MAAVTLRMQSPATPENVRHLRTAARRWLGEVLDDADAVEAMTLAVSEAVENAVDHAFTPGRPGTVTLTARHRPEEPDAVLVSVRDDGHWQEPGAAGYRGRGLALIEACCPGAEVRVGDEGTEVVLRPEVGGTRGRTQPT